MRARKTARSALVASIAGLALPGAAGAEYLVPPGNSAATQYTEAVPTAGGHLDAEKARPDRGRTPSQILGQKKTQELEAQGEAGREIAEFTAESAPSGSAAQQPRPQPQATRTAGSGDKRPAENADRDRGQSRDRGGEATVVIDEDAGPGGSGGFGEVAGQATGLSSGELSPLLPLAIVATAAWAVAFLVRRRQKSTA